MPPRRDRHRWVGHAGIAFSLLIFSVAALFLYRELTHIDFGRVLAHMREHSWLQLLSATLLTAGGYLVLTFYDVLALRYVRHALSYGRTALTSFMAYAVGHNVGVTSLSGGSIRYRMYSIAGLSAIEIAKIVVFCTLTFALGAASLLGASLLLMPEESVSALHLPTALTQLAGALLLGVACAYLTTTLLRRRPLEIGTWLIALPRPRLAASQLLVSALDLTLAASVLYTLLPPTASVHFLPFLGVYVLAIAAGIASSLPAGIGVFESVVLLCLPDVDREALLGTILIYRLLYYVLPLVLALVLLVGHELASHRATLRRAGDLASDRLSRIAPQAVGIAVFLAGVVLLVSGASPAVSERLAFLDTLMPLPLLELSHLAGSALGVGLLILARGLYRRLASAYQVASVALLLGMAASLLKGLDYEEAVLLGLTWLILWSARGEFYRRASLLDQRFTPSWVGSVALVIAGSIWIGFFSYRHVDYSAELWWQFAFNGGAPRMLRASLAAVVAASTFALWKLLHTAAQHPSTGSAEEFDEVRRIAAESPDSGANAALIGDKYFLFDASRSAFLMYRVSGRSWVALGDPVGPSERWEELCWRFRELCDRYDGWPVFYEVSDSALTTYIDMGLTLSKLGEDARIPLSEFSLDGSRNAELRQARSRSLRAGSSFAVLEPAQVDDLLPELRRVSDAWLTTKSVAEKGFSVGAFSETYLRRFPCAIVRFDGHIVAFANLWRGVAGTELSVDLMRYSEQAPKGIMDYLLIELMLWGKAQGFSHFSLGMAPLSGLEAHPLATLWHKVGRLIFRYGENFYNFEGLRRYKEKFHPQWQARYLACPGGLALPRVLLDVSLLISGGARGLVAKPPSERTATS